MKKILYWILTILQAALLAGCVLFEKLSKTKMGVMRHVLYTNSKWEKKYPIDWIKYGVSVILILLALLFVFFLIRGLFGGHARFLPAASITVFIAASAGCAFILLLGSKNIWRTYYYICMALAGIVLLQLPKAVNGLQSLKR